MGASRGKDGWRDSSATTEAAREPRKMLNYPES